MRTALDGALTAAFVSFLTVTILIIREIRQANDSRIPFKIYFPRAAFGIGLLLLSWPLLTFALAFVVDFRIYNTAAEFSQFIDTPLSLPHLIRKSIGISIGIAAPVVALVLRNKVITPGLVDYAPFGNALLRLSETTFAYPGKIIAREERKLHIEFCNRWYEAAIYDLYKANSDKLIKAAEKAILDEGRVKSVFAENPLGNKFKHLLHFYKYKVFLIEIDAVRKRIDSQTLVDLVSPANEHLLDRLYVFHILDVVMHVGPVPCEAVRFTEKLGMSDRAERARVLLAILGSHRIRSHIKLEEDVAGRLPVWLAEFVGCHPEVSAQAGAKLPVNRLSPAPFGRRKSDWPPYWRFVRAIDFSDS